MIKEMRVKAQGRQKIQIEELQKSKKNLKNKQKTIHISKNEE